MTVLKKAWEEHWVTSLYHNHTSQIAPVHIVEHGPEDCPANDGTQFGRISSGGHEQGGCPVVVITREMVAGCDTDADIESRAHLIGAAPELYRALRGLLDAMDAPRPRLLNAIEAAQTALKKARGES